MSKKEWAPLSYGQVKIRDSFLCNSMRLERDYLLSLDVDRLLADEIYISLLELLS